MYTPKRYESKSDDFNHELIEAHPFASLITSENDRSFLTQTALVWPKNGSKSSLFGHIAKMNPQTNMLYNGALTHALFAGEHHYMSPSWYLEKSVPTWNYMSVQVWGRIRVIDDKKTFLDELDAMTKHFEARYKTAYSLDTLSKEYLAKNLNVIHGFYIDIDRVEGKAKLSQNKSAETRQRIRTELEVLGSDNALGVAKKL
jgi:transcriptional regulator